MPETKDLIRRKAVFEDWESLYRQVWSQQETARYMAWDLTASEEEARARMERTLAFQASHDFHWTVVEKKSGQAIGWAGMEQREPGVWGETGIALGPAFTGQGYGKQILNALTDLARDQLGAKRFVGCARRENTPSRKLQLKSGFHYTHSEEKLHPRDQILCIYDYFEKEL